MATLGVTVPEPAADPSGNAITGRDSAAMLEMADGSLRQHFRGTRRQYKVQWKGVTSAERDTLWTRYKVRTAQAWSTAESVSATVLVVPGTWTEASIRTSSGYVWNVGMTLEESAAST
jgi:hypothetical protein